MYFGPRSKHKWSVVTLNTTTQFFIREILMYNYKLLKGNCPDITHNNKNPCNVTLQFYWYQFCGGIPSFMICLFNLI